MNAATNSLMTSIESQGAFFDVVESPIMAGTKLVPGKKALCRKDDGTPLGIVSTNYRTVTNAEIFEKFGSALSKSNLKMDGAKVNVAFANGGARTMVRMNFPEHNIEVGKGDKSTLEIVCKNSYDGRWNFSVRGGACRMACLNGMLLGDWMAAYSEYHNSKLSVDHAADKVVAIVESFDSTEADWKQLSSTSVKDLQAWRALSLYSKRKDLFKKGLAANAEGERRNQVTKMFDQYIKREKAELGGNAFAVYNAMTHHATHAKAREGKDAISLDLRMKQVQDVLGSRYWKDQIIGKAA